ncbi:hypothetical protein HWV62_2733 [Athelia sp. TMB]|nr:hypothetical protein HWV62_2733 [Athelia sp. TMB]
MTTKAHGKRPAPTSQAPSKKRKLAPASKNAHQKNGAKPKAKGKDKASDRKIIPIPIQPEDSEDESDLQDHDLDILEEYGANAGFLQSLDQTGISRSKKETLRLHQLNKPVRKAVEDDLPSLNSEDENEDEEDWNSDLDESSLGSGSDLDDEDAGQHAPDSDDSDAEMSYEAAPRKMVANSDDEENFNHLPTKLADGRIKKSESKPTALAAVSKPQADESDDDDVFDEDEAERLERYRVEDVSTGARFGRPAVADVIANPSRKARVQAAKDQIAGICQEIIADPENNLGLLRRLHTFSLTSISTPSHPDPVINDPIIRKLAILSQVAVFKDIIPGYRIRALTDKEKAEKVSQMVARTRDWEQGLVVVYQSYLRSLETELKSRSLCYNFRTYANMHLDKSELAEVALQCMCTLAADVTHFNFRVNLMTCIVARLSKKSWDKLSDLCLNTLVKVFRADLTGTPSLEIVRLLNRMIKERRYQVHPNVLSCLVHLRLKTELSVRSSDAKADREQKPARSFSKGKAASRRAHGKHTDQPHLSKKAQKVLKEKKEIAKEFREAEAEVDKEERAVTHTESLKLLFVLYFSILKNPRPTPLLPGALQGISRFAHLVNIDFFKDLLKVLKGLISPEADDAGADDAQDAPAIQHRLLCIVTAFELLSGQGEALNIDLSDFIGRLYTLLLPLGLMPDIDAPPPPPHTGRSTADMLFRALELVFAQRAAPPWRGAAFAKRLLGASLHWPPAPALRALGFVRGLLAADARLAALLATDDRTVDGVYRADLEDPQLSNPFAASFWELHVLRRAHYDARVRAAAGELAAFVRA